MLEWVDCLKGLGGLIRAQALESGQVRFEEPEQSNSSSRTIFNKRKSSNFQLFFILHISFHFIWSLKKLKSSCFVV
jgi:hypothetical protein